jgi:hypothetical protein
MKYALIALMLSTVACSRSEQPQPTTTTTTSAQPSTSAPPPAPSGPTAPAQWSGNYKSERGTIYVPDGGEWSGTKWRGDDSKDGLGEGKLVLTIDPTTGRVEGTLDGPLGPAIVYGQVTGERVAATVARKDIADRGFTGTLQGSLAAGAIEGTLKMSLADAHVIREAHFQLKKGS